MVMLLAMGANRIAVNNAGLTAFDLARCQIGNDANILIPFELNTVEDLAKKYPILATYIIIFKLILCLLTS
jgi:hypothetical protein